MPDYEVFVVRNSTFSKENSGALGDGVSWQFRGDVLPQEGDIIDVTMGRVVQGNESALGSTMRARVTSVDEQRNPPIHANQLD